MDEIDLCKGILLTKKVTLVARLCISCFYGHAVNNSHNNLFSTAIAGSLCDEKTQTMWVSNGCNTSVTHV